MLEKFDRSYLVGTAVVTVVLVLLSQIFVRLLSLVSRVAKQKRDLNAFDGPPTHWLYGNVHQFRDKTKVMDVVMEHVKQFAKCHQFWLGPLLPIVRLYHPDYMQVLLKTTEPKLRFFYKNLEPWIGEGLLISHGKKWARSRRLLTPAFHFDILKPYIKVFADSANTMTDKWYAALKKSRSRTVSLDMFEHISLMTLDSILKCAFSYGCDVQNTGKRNPYIKAVYDMSRLVVERAEFLPFASDWIYYFSYSGYCFRKACKIAHDLSTRVIESRRKTLKEKGHAETTKQYLDFLDILLTAKDEDGNGLTEQEIRNEVDTFLFEGHDTTASGISWCLYNLARHPEYQDRCREEVNRIMVDRDTLTWNDMSQLEFVTMCIKESLRTHPPVPGVGRQITKPLVLPDNRSLSKGMCFDVSIYSMHHNPEVWNDPELYDPYRFSPESSKDRSPHAFIPFSAGPRNCIGQHFAMNEMKTCIALVLKKFSLKVDYTKKVTKIPELILRSSEGIWLEISPIDG